MILDFFKTSTFDKLLDDLLFVIVLVWTGSIVITLIDESCVHIIDLTDGWIEDIEI